MKEKVTKDYSNYDYITLTVKKDKAEEVITSYGAFRWEEINRVSDKVYGDIIHVTFKRVHNIHDKDALQYLQVLYESRLNERSLLDNRKHHKSSIISSVIGLFTMLLFCLSLSLIFFVENLIACIFSGALLLLCSIITVFFVKFIRRLRNKEKSIFDFKINKINAEINDILSKSKELTGQDL